jgi:aminodeoxyfutalosine deaminase
LRFRNQMDSIRIQADAIIASPDEIYRPGQIVVSHGVVQSIGTDCRALPDLELNGWQLSAGLVNAHTHLEFSQLEQPFSAGANFPEWIGQVVGHRRNEENQLSANELHGKVTAARWFGLEESWSAGVALIGDIATRPWSARDFPSDQFPVSGTGKCLDPQWARREASGFFSHDQWRDHLSAAPRILALPEFLGLDSSQLAQSIDWAISARDTDFAQQNFSKGSLIWDIGLSPHSPYSLNFDSVRQTLGAIEWHATGPLLHRLMAMHVAESLEERQWLESASGPFREAFQRIGVPIDTPRTSIAAVIDWLAACKKSLLIHGNYLTQLEIERIARSRSISVVYCPRTHQHFGHADYPLLQFIEAGVAVALATDSRASNPDLDLWEEVRTVRTRFPNISARWLYCAVTQAAAEALGVEQKFGSLRPGRMAALNVSRHDADVPTPQLLDDLISRVRPFQPLTRWLINWA